MANTEPVTVDTYRYRDPLFESARIVLNALGETHSPEYIQGVSGAAFKIATGCPSRPTCEYDKWPDEFIKMFGYEVETFFCADANGNDTTDLMIEAVKRQIGSGKPVPVWHAFTEQEWDVVCAYDDDAKEFVGRGFYRGNGDELARAPWDRAKNGICGFGAIIVGEKTSAFDSRAAEVAAISNAVKFARRTRPADAPDWKYEGIEAYKKWAEKYAAPGAERNLPDAYCHEVYSSSRKAAPVFLRGIAAKYDKRNADILREAADCFEREAEFLAQAEPLIGFKSPAGVDEERSAKLAPILQNAAEAHEKAIVCLEKFEWDFGLPGIVAESRAKLRTIKINQPDWKDEINSEYPQMVCVSVADIFLRHGNVAVNDPIFVTQSDPWPIAYYVPAPTGERQIGLASKGPYRSQLAYQFAHEFCHTIVKQWEAAFHHNNMWFTECFCELASIWCITKIGEDWAAGYAPREDWKSFARHMTDYVNNHTRNTRRFESPAECAEWLTERLPECYKNSKPGDVFKIIPVQLLPHFLEDPTLWEPVAYLNADIVAYKDADFKTYIRHWHDAVPTELKPKVVKIVGILGFAVNDVNQNSSAD